MSTVPDNPEQVLVSILEDFDSSRGLFEANRPVDDVDLPLKEALSELEAKEEIDDDHERALYITFNLAVNFAKPADRLSQRVRGLWKTESWTFDPSTLAGDQRYYDLLDLFKGQGEFESHPIMERHGLMEHGKRDTDIWYTIAHTLYHEFQSDPLELLDTYDNDARAIYDYVSMARHNSPVHEEVRMTKKFPSLGAEKVGPLWLRALDDYVRSLDNIALLPIPVDRQIADVTNHIFGTDYSADNDQDRDEIRTLYREFCEENDWTSTRLDKALWLIGESWETGGRGYLARKLDQY